MYSGIHYRNSTAVLVNISMFSILRYKSRISLWVIYLVTCLASLNKNNAREFDHNLLELSHICVLDQKYSFKDFVHCKTYLQRIVKQSQWNRREAYST